MIQFFAIFSLYIAISNSIGSGSTYHSFLYSFGMFAFAAGLGLNIFSLTMSLDEGFRKVKSLKVQLKELLVYEREKGSRQKIKNLIDEVAELDPLSGNGFFEINKATLTGMISVSITYIIILVQFKIST